MKNKLALASTIISAVVSTGAGSVVGNAIKASTPANASLVKKVTLGVGGLALSSLAAHHAVQHTGDQLTDAVDKFQQLKTAYHAEVKKD